MNDDAQEAYLTTIVQVMDCDDRMYYVLSYTLCTGTLEHPHPREKKRRSWRRVRVFILLFVCVHWSCGLVVSPVGMLGTKRKGEDR